MPDQISLRKETNLYDDEKIKDTFSSTNTNITDVNNKVVSQYAVSSTASATVAKTATVEGNFSLYKNVRVSVYFSNANTATSPTLNIAGTGAKPIWAYGGALSATGNTFNWVAKSTIEFVYDGSHWVVVDSGAVGLISKYDEKLNQEVVFNKLTNNGAIRGIFMQNGQLYINMDYLQTGTIKLGGSNNGNGLMIVYDASGNEIGRWSNAGISATGNLTMKSGNMTGYIGTVTYPSYSTSNNTLSFNTGTGFGIVNDNSYYTVRPTGSNLNIATFAQTGWYEQNYVGSTSGDGFIEYKMLSTLYYQRYLFPTGTYKSSRYYLDEYFSPTTGSYRMHSTLFASGSPYRVRLSLNADQSLLDIVAGSVNIAISSSSQKINGKNIQFVSSSSKRYKHNITEEIIPDLDPHKLYQLRMKQFVYNDGHLLQYEDTKGKTIPGFIAEDVAEIYPSAVIHDIEENVESWDERRIIPGMLALIQEQKKQLDEQAERIKKLEENTSFIYMDNDVNSLQEILLCDKIKKKREYRL